MLPGLSPDGSFDAGCLRSWVWKARELALQKDRAVVVDHEIGRILSYAPNDPEDGAWPHKGLRDLLEELSNGEIETGVSIAQFNKRGVVSRGVLEGGKQERELAAQWREWGKMVGNRWPRTATLLREISKSWEHVAKLEDEDAEQTRLRLQ
jgi:hypothetical protein